jgi:hypothetical protein
LGIRYKNKEDKQRLEKLIEEFNIKTIFDQPLSYPIRDINLYRDGRMTNYNILWVLYDSDGEKIYESPCK